MIKFLLILASLCGLCLADPVNSDDVQWYNCNEQKGYYDPVKKECFRNPCADAKFPHIAKCNKYYQCSEDFTRLVEMDCDNEFYNPNIQECDKRTCYRYGDCEINYPYLLRDYGDCSSYYECSQEKKKLIPKQCPKYHVFVETTYKGYGGCKRTECPVNICQSFKVPIAEDEYSYWKCEKGKPERVYCDAGMSFSLDFPNMSNDCRLPETINAEANAMQGEEVPGEEEKMPGEEEKMPGEGDAPNSEDEVMSTSTTTEENSPEDEDLFDLLSGAFGSDSD